MDLANEALAAPGVLWAASPSGWWASWALPLPACPQLHCVHGWLKSMPPPDGQGRQNPNRGPSRGA